MSDTSLLNLDLLPTECFHLIAQNYSLEGLIELAKNPAAPSAQAPMLFSHGKRHLGEDSKYALAPRPRLLQLNEKKAIRAGALQVIDEHLQLLVQNNVRLMGKPGHDEPNLILEKTLQEQKREIAALLTDDNDAISAEQKIKLNTAASMEGTYVGDLIVIDALLNELNMSLIQPHLDTYETEAEEQQRYLELAELGLTRFPEESIVKLQRYPRLITLNLVGNRLTTLPDSFGNLVALTYLYLHYNQLVALPDSFGNLVALSSLSLSNNQLVTLPDSFGNLVALTGLKLENNQLVTWPNSFGKLVALSWLDLENNQLVTLPESFGSLVALSWLGLENNQLATLPDSFGNLVALARLGIQKNQLAILPKSFGNLVGLKTLWMHNNPLISLPRSMRQILRQTDNEDLLPLLTPVPVHMDESKDDISPAAAAATYTPSAKKQGQKRKAEEENNNAAAEAEEKPIRHKKQK